MDDVDISLQVLTGTFLSIGICVLGFYFRKIRNQPTMKASPSMEDLNSVVTEDPSS